MRHGSDTFLCWTAEAVQCREVVCDAVATLSAKVVHHLAGKYPRSRRLPFRDTSLCHYRANFSLIDSTWNPSEASHDQDSRHLRQLA